MLHLLSAVSLAAGLSTDTCEGDVPLAPLFTPSFAASDLPMLRHTLDDPDALCNDGSPAVIYVRPAYAADALDGDAPPSADWLIFFDGGGSCPGADECLDRWCGTTGEIYNRAGKMSSLRAAEAIRPPGGIFGDGTTATENSFDAYNQVLVHYCSSDQWSGDADSTLITSDGTTYDIGFHGAAIVDAVFDQLLSGPTLPDVPRGSSMTGSVPDLHGAARVLIGAESAGTGIVHQLDRLRERLEGEIDGVDVRAVLDAGLSPSRSGSAIDWESTEPGTADSFADLLDDRILTTALDVWGMPVEALDASCAAPADPDIVAEHERSGGHPEVCYENQYVRLNHLTTPVFSRMDLTDPMPMEHFLEDGMFPGPVAFALATAQQLREFGTGKMGIELPLATPGVFGPSCGRHVAIQTNDGFFGDVLRGPVDPPSFHDQLVDWLDGVAGTRVQLDAAGAGYTPSRCR